MRMLRTVLAAICIAVITLCAVMISQKLLGRARIDLTEHSIYTLSQGTRNILAKLNQPVHMKLYYSRVAAMKAPEGIRFFNNYYLYVRDLLEEYVKLAQGKLTLDVIDPRPFSEEEEDALRFGLRKIPMPGDESFFFGLVVQTELGKDKVIELFDPDRQEFVEYDVSKLISSVTLRDKKKIGILSSLPVMGSDMSPYMIQMMRMQGRSPQEPWTIVTHLKEEYEVTKVDADAESIDEQIDFLMVIHPKDLPENTLFAIDQFVMKGGKLLVFVDPYCFEDQPKQTPGNPMPPPDYKSSSDLNALLAGWGVKMEPDLFAADRKCAITTSTGRNTPRAPLVTFLQLDESCVNKNEVVTAKLHDLRVLFAGILEPVEGSGTEFVPLLTTTEKGGTWRPSSPFELRFPDPMSIAKRMTGGDEKITLACRIAGKLKTNFPDGITVDAEDDDDEVAADENAEGEKKDADEGAKAADDEKENDGEEKDKNSGKKTRKIEAIKEASEEAAVMVFADVDMIADRWAYSKTFFGTAQVGDNASLVFNALEYLSGTGDLIAIRSRGRFSRPFKVVDEIEAQAQEATARKVDALNERIKKYEEELRQLGSQATEKNLKIIQSKAVQKRAQLQKKIRQAQKELRALNADKREKIEALGAALQTNNMVWAPAIILLIAVILATIRFARAKHYAARRGG